VVWIGIVIWVRVGVWIWVVALNCRSAPIQTAVASIVAIHKFRAFPVLICASASAVSASLRGTDDRQSENCRQRKQNGDRRVPIPQIPHKSLQRFDGQLDGFLLQRRTCRERSSAE